MKTKKVTRRQVIYAMRNERLRPGAWFHTKEGGKDEKLFNAKYATKRIENCSVCAVGAVMRAATFTKEKFVMNEPTAYERANRLHSIALILTDEITSRGDIDNLLLRRNYLGALSVFFEDMMRLVFDDKVRKHHREQLVNFVKKNFPKVLVIKY